MNNADRLPTSVIYAAPARSDVGQSHIWAPTTPDPVAADLTAHQAQVEREENRAGYLDHLTQERYTFLTEDSAGLSLVMEEMYASQGTDADYLIYKIYRYGIRHDSRRTLSQAFDLVQAIDELAWDMARKWASKRIQEEDRMA